MISSCFYKAPFTIKLPLLACTKIMRKMSRLTLIHVFLAWLLLAAASQYSYFTISVHAVESVHFRLRKGQQPGSRSHNGDALPRWVEEKKIHKTPSGPNPMGNHRPPSRR
ncbi:CLAVATA3/ESR (CLE)-related protein 46-like [Juglans microcarpa x Juglans regia]|uniref:CLAVATA3/ESR (CLE)-related protein 46-like n=1 Tax=Juglans microcarpa x Juglans regia TaxID=2249226 RepID=UPI001B7F0C47|nr:CLAVATA3/ESR (CLE)-related protein 46-like [Juglans microcarpa x Juglans regia]